MFATLKAGRPEWCSPHLEPLAAQDADHVAELLLARLRPVLESRDRAPERVPELGDVGVDHRGMVRRFRQEQRNKPVRNAGTRDRPSGDQLRCPLLDALVCVHATSAAGIGTVRAQPRRHHHRPRSHAFVRVRPQTTVHGRDLKNVERPGTARFLRTFRRVLNGSSDGVRDCPGRSPSGETWVLIPGPFG